jgi:methionine-R-sulfoxide reductase
MTTTTLLIVGAAVAAIAFAGISNTMKPNGHSEDLSGSPKRADKVVLTDAEWKKRLTPDQYRILRNAGTEPAFCGRFHDSKGEGVYFCVGCNLELFKSDNKFQSGSGWPSFFQPYKEENVWFRDDMAYGMHRVEVLCARCDGHLGHVFEDGPKPTGLRFCINSEILTFKTFDAIKAGK